MAKVQIKRSKTAQAPSTLSNGELAYSFASQKLFIGDDQGNVIPIGGDGQFMTASEVATVVNTAIDVIDGGTF